MKTILTTLGAFVLISCISNSVTVDLEATDPDKPVVSILDLPFELLLDIFTQLDLAHAVSIAKTHPYNREVVDDMIRRLFSNQTLDITVRVNTIVGSGIEYNPKYVKFELILDLFKYFGHHITKLLINYNRSIHDFINKTQHETLNEYISKYGATSLKEIDFRYRQTTYNPLVGLNGPFPNVKSVHLSNGRIDSKTNLSEIFPAVRSLDVGYMVFVAENTAQNFPCLERLTIPKYWANNISNYPSFEKIVKLNPQLKHLQIRECNWNILQMLNKIRPDLESLEIDYINFFGDENATVPLRFNNMKKLKFAVGLLFGPSDGDFKRIPLEFGNLEEIEFNRRDLFNLWIQNRHLKKFIAITILYRNDLDRIATELPELEEFKMICRYNDNSVQEIVDFIQNVNQLKRASFLKLMKTECEEVAQQLNNEWENVENNNTICSFVRK